MTSDTPASQGSRWAMLSVVLAAALIGGCVLACLGVRMLSIPRRESIFPATPGTDVIAFETDRGAGTQIYLMYPDGTQQTRLTYNVRLAPEWWLPMTVVGGDLVGHDLLPPLNQDGTVIFRSLFEDEFYTYQIELDGSQQTRFSTPLRSDQVAVWSPNRSELVFRTPEKDLAIIQSDGMAQRCLPCASSLDAFNPAWSPDGQQIGFVAGAPGQIYRINRDGTGLTQLTDTPGSFSDDIAWSPDGTRIAFRSNRDGPHSHIYVMNADGSGQQQLTQGAAIDLYPAWSPDGQQITFTSLRDTPQGAIYRMNADGSGQQRLTMQGKNRRSVWIHVPATYCETHVCPPLP